MSNACLAVSLLTRLLHSALNSPFWYVVFEFFVPCRLETLLSLSKRFALVHETWTNPMKRQSAHQNERVELAATC